ncbi:hypothetical protein BJ508DRAFT_79606 [Ascobolus immersus RN42]|uniref:Uncharacterized protein n=1 Tax=Ascobolus immersus RN42 TaxID=1160509 RepID=A0A3N4HET8_ASCIM|nr:hypothetical protein BJ508DRAFT_79606 [Ascobolus immersus RN42]
MEYRDPALPKGLLEWPVSGRAFWLVQEGIPFPALGFPSLSFNHHRSRSLPTNDNQAQDSIRFPRQCWSTHRLSFLLSNDSMPLPSSTFVPADQGPILPVTAAAANGRGQNLNGNAVLPPPETPKTTVQQASLYPEHPLATTNEGSFAYMGAWMTGSDSNLNEPFHQLGGVRR